MVSPGAPGELISTSYWLRVAELQEHRSESHEVEAALHALTRAYQLVSDANRRAEYNAAIGYSAEPLTVRRLKYRRLPLARRLLLRRRPLPEVDYFEVLGIAPSANGRLVADAYRIMRDMYLRLHPGTPRRAELLALLREAYAVIQDDERRVAYEASRARRFGASRNGATPSSSVPEPELNAPRPKADRERPTMPAAASPATAETPDEVVAAQPPAATAAAFAPPPVPEATQTPQAELIAKTSASEAAAPSAPVRKRPRQTKRENPQSPPKTIKVAAEVAVPLAPNLSPAVKSQPAPPETTDTVIETAVPPVLESAPLVEAQPSTPPAPEPPREASAPEPANIIAQARVVAPPAPADIPDPTPTLDPRPTLRSRLAMPLVSALRGLAGAFSSLGHVFARKPQTAPVLEAAGDPPSVETVAERAVFTQRPANRETRDVEEVLLVRLASSVHETEHEDSPDEAPPTPAPKK